MTKYKVSLSVDKNWIDRFDLTFEADSEHEAESMAMIEVKQNLSDYITDTGSADYVQFQLAGMSGSTGDVGILFFTGGSQNNQYYFSSEL